MFESAFAQVDLAVPFHMSIFTGPYSTEYGMVSKDILLIPSGVRLESRKSEYKEISSPVGSEAYLMNLNSQEQILAISRQDRQRNSRIK